MGSGANFALNFPINVTGTGKLRDIAGEAAELKKELGLSTGNLRLFQASFDSLTKSGLSTKQALSDITKSIETLPPGVRRLAQELQGADAGFKAASQGAQQFGNTIRSQVVAPLTATSGAIRVLEGQQSIRVVENLLGKTLGLGPAFQAAFPIFGAVAMVGMVSQIVDKVGKLYNEWDPVIRAQERALSSMKELNSEYSKLSGDSLKRIYDDIENRPGAAGGRANRLRAEARDAAGDARYQDQARIDTTLKQIEEAQRRVTAGTIAATPPGIRVGRDGSEFAVPGTPGGLTRDAQAAQVDLQRLDNQLENAKLRQRDDELKAQDLRGEAAKLDLKNAEEVARKASSISKQIEEITNRSAELEDKARFERFGKIGDVLVRRNANERQYESKFADIDREQKENPELKASYDKERKALTESRTKDIASLGRELVKAALDEGDRSRLQKAENEQTLNRPGAAMTSFRTLQERFYQSDIRDQVEGFKTDDQIEGIRSQTQREGVIRLSEQQGRRARDQANSPEQAATIGLQAQLKLAQDLFDIDMKRASAEEDISRRRILTVNAEADLERKTSDARIAAETEILDIRKRQADSRASTFSSGLMAAFTGGGEGFGRSLGRSIGATMLDNIGKELFRPGNPATGQKGGILDSLIPSISGTGTLGKPFQGTGLFNITGDKSPLIEPANKLDIAAVKLSAAGDKLQGVGGGVGGGGTAGPGVSGGGSTLSSNAALTTFGSDIGGLTGGSGLGIVGPLITGVGALAAGATAIGRTVSTGGGGNGQGGNNGNGPSAIVSTAKNISNGFGTFASTMANPFGDKGGTPGVNGQPGVDNGHISKMGIAAAGADVALGAFTAISQFKKGGARGALGGTSAVLGTAAALTASVPILGEVLGIAALGTSLIKSVLGDPKVIRQQQINRTLFMDQYRAPAAQNITSSTNGGFSDLGRDGNIRTSLLSPYTRNTVAYGDRPFRTNIPSEQTSQFGGGGPVTVHINTLDSQSLESYLKKNSTVVTEAVAHGLAFGQTKLPQAIRGAVGQA